MNRVKKTFFLVFIGFLALSFAGFAFGNPQKAKDEKMPEKYKKWMDEEVLYIMSDNEKAVFKSLTSDEQRENFIRTFWRRRDPTPETPFNEFREEHYRRIEFANKNFFEGRIGWRTDRGRVYIMFGPPDFRETNPGGSKGFLFEGADTAEFSSERWTYRQIPGLKARISRIEFIFVNYYETGVYQLTDNPALANALRNISIPERYVGYSDYIPMDSDAPDREAVAQQARDEKMLMSPMESLSLMAQLTKSRGEVLEELERTTRLRKLKGFVESRESLAALTFFAKENYIKGEGNLTYIPISMEVAAKDLSFKKKDDRYLGMVNFYIEVKDEKGTVYQASDRLEMKLREETYQRRLSDFYQYKHSLSLAPGEYFVHLVVWDEFNNNVGYFDRKIIVPQFSDDEFNISEVILARNLRIIEQKNEDVVMDTKDIPELDVLKGKELKVPDKIKITQERGGPFVFGNVELNPNTTREYTRDDELIFFYQVYNPTFDSASQVAKLYIEHQVWRAGNLITAIGNPREVHIPIEQKGSGLNSIDRYPLTNFYAGTFTLLIRIKDIHSGKTIEKKVDFRMK